jgi:enoyl-CoA hydratase/carnithine racemase
MRSSDATNEEDGMSDDARVNYETREDGRVAVVSMARVRYRNALSPQMMAELESAFDRAVDDDDVRVIVLRGEGPSFSAGHDLGSSDMGDRAERDAAPMAEKYNRNRALDPDPLLRFRAIPKPTIAMVQGHCIYAAWMLASSMDVIFAAKDAQFLATNFQYFSVPWDIGARRAKHLLFENRFIDGNEALELGFVQEAHPADRLEEETIGYASRVAEMDPFQLQMMKHSINQMQEIQGFTAHIMSSHSDRMVRGANAVQATVKSDESESGRHLYLNVERARSRRQDG